MYAKETIRGYNDLLIHVSGLQDMIQRYSNLWTIANLVQYEFPI